MIACLSPNGRTQYRSSQPVTTLFVGTAKGIYRLERFSLGSRWQIVGQTLERLHISSLDHEPRTGLLVAGAHHGGFHISSDGGRTWEECSSGLISEHVYTVAARDRNGQVVLFAGTEPAAFHRSDDLGKTWRELPALRHLPGREKWTFPGPPHVAHLKNLAFDPRDPAVIYAGVEQGALLKSTDEGHTWREIESYASADDEYYRDIHRIALDPANPDVIYLATGIGAYRSDDAGETWVRLTRPGDRIGYPDGLVIDPWDGTVFMAGAAAAPPAWNGMANATVMRSRDRGHTWEEIHTGLPVPLRGNIEALSLCEWPEGVTLVAGTATGEVYSSEDRGDSWQLIASGLGPVAKGGHYFSFLAPEERAAVLAAR